MVPHSRDRRYVYCKHAHISISVNEKKQDSF